MSKTKITLDKASRILNTHNVSTALKDKVIVTTKPSKLNANNKDKLIFKIGN